MPEGFPVPLREMQQELLDAWLTHRPLKDDIALIPAERERVYRDGIHARFHSVLGDTYSTIWKNLNHQELHALIDEYIAAHPPQSYNINNLGQHLPTFLKSNALAERYAFLVEVATHEWAFNHTFHTTQQPPMNMRTFATLSTEQLNEQRVRLQDTLQLFTYYWNILEIVKGDEPRQEKHHVMMYRTGLGVQADSISADAYEVLQALKTGKSMSDILDMLEARQVDAATVSSFFQSWIEKDLFVSFY